MPCELVQHFSPASPLLVGGVLPAEEGSGHLQLRLKRHRWFPRILKTRDPLVFSIGAPGHCLSGSRSAMATLWRAAFPLRLLNADHVLSTGKRVMLLILHAVCRRFSLLSLQTHLEFVLIVATFGPLYT